MKNALLFSLFMSISLSIYADFLKMSNDAEILELESSEWSCVLDNKSSLVWEVKSENEGLQYALNTYTWFDVFEEYDNKVRYTEYREWASGNLYQSDLDDYKADRQEEKQRRLKKMNNNLNYFILLKEK